MGGISKNMGENIRDGNFPGVIDQGGFLLVEIFRVGAFLIPKKIYAKGSEVYMHGHWSSSEKYSYSKPIASVFIPAPKIIFSYGVEIFPYPSVKLIGYVTTLVGYIEM